MPTQLGSDSQSSSDINTDSTRRAVFAPDLAQVSPHAANLGFEGNLSQVVSSRPNKTSFANWMKYLLQMIVFSGVGFGLSKLSMQTANKIDLPPTSAALKADAPIAVTIAPVQRQALRRSIEAVGNMYGYDEVTLKTKVSGRVSKIYHDFADRVEQGELLLELDPTDAKLAVEQSKRSLSSELAKWGFSEVPRSDADLTQLPTVVSARLRADLAKLQLDRLNALQDRGAVIADELDQAKTNSLVTQSDYSNQLLMARAGAATSQLKKAELDIAEQNLKETSIYAPKRSPEKSEPTATSYKDYKYTITERLVSEGAWLAAGTDVFRLVIDETMKLRLTIPEQYSADVRVGQSVEVSVMALKEPVWGKVARISPAVDPQTRTFQIEAEVPNPAGVLKSGGFAKARVITKEADAATIVPLSALETFAGVHKVFVLKPDDTVTEVQVKLGEQTSEWVEITEPELTENSQVITSGQRQLADRSIVRVRMPEPKLGADNSAEASGEKK